MGTYYYTITEKDLGTNAPKGVTKDGKSLSVKVDVADVDGELQASVTYDGAASFGFSNPYTPAPTTAQFEGTKTISGRDWDAEQDNGVYTFVLAADDTKNAKDVTVPMPDETEYTVKAEGAGNIVFSAIT